MKGHSMIAIRHLGRAARNLGMGAAALALLTVATPAAAETPGEAANKQVVLGFYAALNEADAAGSMGSRIQSIAEQYLSAGYVQHSDMFANLPGPGSARDKLVRMFQSMSAGGAPPMPPQQTVAVMAEGDLVMLLTSRTAPNPATGQTKVSYAFNLFRVSDGKLVEHWDSASAPPGPGGPPPPG